MSLLRATPRHAPRLWTGSLSAPKEVGTTFSALTLRARCRCCASRAALRVLLLAALCGGGVRRVSCDGLVPRPSGPCTRACGDASGVTIVAAQCTEDLSWLRREFRDVAVCAKLECGLRGHTPLAVKAGLEPPDARCSQESRLGFEAASFLRFLISRFGEIRDEDSLAFLHGHQAAWHQGQSAGMPSLIRRVRKGAGDFVNLNGLFTGPISDAHRTALEEFWNRTVAPYWDGKPFPCRAAMNVPWCVVHKGHSNDPSFSDCVSIYILNPPPFPPIFFP